jgi:hypothetical protein
MSLLISALCTVRIGPLDGKVGAMISDGHTFITSSSQDYVPYPPLGSHRQVQLRSDSRYADDDPILWPQPFIPYFSHYGAIPQPYSLYEHQVIWWMPSHDHFVRHAHPASPVSGLGKLSNIKFAELKASVDSLLERLKNYQAKTPSERQPRILHPFVKMLVHSLARLESVYTNFRQMEFSIRDVQRTWLELTALLDYMEIYKPRMDGHAHSASEVANTIGVFTHDLRVAQDFFTAGLPCWLIRPASDFINQIIHKVVVPEDPKRTLCFRAHSFSYPVLFTGPASSHEKYHLIHQYARNFLRAPDPFNTSSDPERIAPSMNSPACQRMEAPSVASSSTQHFSAHSRSMSKSHQHGCSKNQHQFGMVHFTLFRPFLTFCRSSTAIFSHPRQVSPCRK